MGITGKDGGNLCTVSKGITINSGIVWCKSALFSFFLGENSQFFCYVQIQCPQKQPHFVYFVFFFHHKFTVLPSHIFQLLVFVNFLYKFNYQFI